VLGNRHHVREDSRRRLVPLPAPTANPSDIGTCRGDKYLPSFTLPCFKACELHGRCVDRFETARNQPTTRSSTSIGTSLARPGLHR
jgi:hypothetical protein